MVKTHGSMFDSHTAKPVMKYRYVCHGCTRPASYGTEPVSGSVMCPHCGMSQAYKPENWVLMGDAEKADVNK